MESTSTHPNDKKTLASHVEHRDNLDQPLDTKEAILRHNREAAARVQNPLNGIPRDQLLRDADAFCVEYGLEEHTDVFRKAATLAQHPSHIDDNELLSDEERGWLNHERAHKWSHPKMLYMTIFLCAVGAATQGWDQTGSNGANLSFPAAFGIGATYDDNGVATSPNAERDEWLVGLINAAPYIGSAFVGCWLSDPLNNIFGRRGVIFITAIVLILTPIGSGFTQNWHQLLIVRLILGLGMGAKGATVPIYAAENSPASIRGALVMGWQLWTAFGIFLGTAANVVVKDVGAIAWRLQLGSAFIPAVPLAVGIMFLPESPRWLMKKGRYNKAWHSFNRLRFHEIQAARDMYAVHAALVEERKLVRANSFIARFTELFTIPRVRRATLASFVVMLGQQLCGINIIAFYSSSVFVRGGFTQDQALYASLGFGALNFVGAFPALWTIDTFGRRALLLTTFPIMALTLLAAGLSFLGLPAPGLPVNKGVFAAIALFIYLFTLAYSVGEGPVPFTYSAEVFPLAQREMGMAWAVSTCLFWAAVLSLTFPRMLRALTPTGAFGLYAAFNIIALILIFLYLPETKQLTLEELDSVFSIPTREHIRYNTGKAVPYFFKRHILRRKDAVLEPLFVSDDAATSQDYGRNKSAIGNAEKGDRFHEEREESI